MRVWWQGVIGDYGFLLHDLTNQSCFCWVNATSFRRSSLCQAKCSTIISVLQHLSYQSRVVGFLLSIDFMQWRQLFLSVKFISAGGYVMFSVSRVTGVLTLVFKWKVFLEIIEAWYEFVQAVSSLWTDWLNDISVCANWPDSRAAVRVHKEAFPDRDVGSVVSFQFYMIVNGLGSVVWELKFDSRFLSESDLGFPLFLLIKGLPHLSSRAASPKAEQLVRNLLYWSFPIWSWSLGLRV